MPESNGIKVKFFKYLIEPEWDKALFYSIRSDLKWKKTTYQGSLV
jgi:hypothetical protein